MKFRSSHVRTKVVALLVSLVALWGFAAFVTLREGLNLLWVSTLDAGVAQPSEPLLIALQQERRLSLVYLGHPGRPEREALDVQRARTDEALAKFQEEARGSEVKTAASPALEKRIDETLTRLEGLGPGREAIDAGRVDRGGGAATYIDVIDSIYRIYDSMATVDDKELAKDVRTLIELSRAGEVLSQEDALMAGVLAQKRLTDAEHAQFIQLVGAQRFQRAEAAANLPDADRARYDQMVGGQAFTRFRELEERLIHNWRASASPPASAEEWKAAVEPALAELQNVVLTGGDAAIQRATPVAAWVIVRLALAGGLGLLAVIASIIVSITTARALVGQLEKLRNAAEDLANKRLPNVVARLGHGEQLDVATEAPPLAFGTDEIGQVGQAFNAVQETAIRVAVEQAELRRSVRDTFLSIARRTQALVHRQLTLLDAMERRETDAEELEDLFRIDHLATRMRRNAENLIVLSGATAGRAWRRSVPMVDVVRGAVAEVEDYTRVTVLPIGSVGLAGRAVGDVIHLLAELIENAVSFSPPYTIVQVGGQMVANGYAIEIEDRGLGMSDEDLAGANERIVNPTEFNLSSTARLGLYVVSRLAERHGIRVRLKDSPYGGTTAVVLIPSTLVIDESDRDGRHAGLPGGPVTIAVDGRRMPHDADEAHAIESPRPAGSDVGTVAVASAPAQTQQRTLTAVAAQRPEPDTPDAPDPTSQVAPTNEAASLSHVRSTADMPSAAALTTDAAQPPAAPLEAQEVPCTPSGLPFRVRQASLAPPLRRDSSTATEPPADDDADGGRPPEEIRKIMTSYQTGTLRGRSDAARLLAEGDDPPPAPSVAEQPPR